MRALVSFFILAFGSWLQAQTLETVFNTPGFDGKSTATIENKLIDLTRQAVAGSSVRAALYTVNRTPIADAFIEASKRGVKVELVLDGGNLVNAEVEGSAINKLVNQLVCAEGEECIKFCKGPLAGPLKLAGIKKNYPVGNSCRGLVINHNKLFLFSELQDGSKNVVVQTSANMMNHQLEMYNDLILIKNDREFFEDFNTYWEKLWADNTVLFKKSFHSFRSAESKVKAYFFPRLTGSDPVLELLKRVNCRLPGSSIRAAQAAFTRSKVAEKMKQLESEGCSLEVITRIDPKQSSPGKEVREALGNSMIVLPFQGATEEEQAVNSTHTKIVLIHASIDNSPEKIPVVLTGSHNLDLFSLRTNDETLLEIRDQGVYERYNAFVSQLLADARAANLKFF